MTTKILKSIGRKVRYTAGTILPYTIASIGAAAGTCAVYEGIKNNDAGAFQAGMSTIQAGGAIALVRVLAGIIYNQRKSNLESNERENLSTLEQL